MLVALVQVADGTCGETYTNNQYLMKNGPAACMQAATWTFVSGTSTANALPSFGTRGIADAGNRPPSLTGFAFGILQDTMVHFGSNGCALLSLCFYAYSVLLPLTLGVLAGALLRALQQCRVHARPVTSKFRLGLGARLVRFGRRRAVQQLEAGSGERLHGSRPATVHGQVGSFA